MTTIKNNRTLFESLQQSAVATANNAANFAVASAELSADLLDALVMNSEGVSLVIKTGVEVTVKSLLTVNANIASLSGSKFGESFENHLLRASQRSEKRWNSSQEQPEVKAEPKKMIVSYKGKSKTL